MRRRRAPFGALVACAAAGLALAACGIPTQPTASPISPNQLPAHLPPARPTVTPCTKSGCISVDVYFVTPSAHLAPFARVVPRDAKLATVVRSLLAGPTAAEQADGITTALGSDIHLLSTDVTAGNKIATLDFSAGFGTLSGIREVLGVAQVVYTVTAIMPGAGVIFEIAGAQTEVPLETGRLWTGAVHEVQYASLLTPTTPATTTP